MIQRYFEEEMRYLQEAGSAFAKVHPDQGRLLNIDSLTDRDPYVERLFEGFAFLTARIREQLDDEMPQYTESLFRLLHPHFVRPVPSLAIEAFTPRAGMLQETVELPAGTEVRSGPVGPNSTMCRFTTAYPVQLQPMKLQEVDLTWPTGTQSTVSMRFLLDRGIEYRQLNLARLRLYFYAEPTKASTMHLFFTRHVRKVELRAEGETATLLGQQWVRPVGFGPEEGLLPYAPYSFTGYRILQEYFCFRPKFWFIDLLGLDRFSPPDGTSDFEVVVHFEQAFPEAQAFRKDNLRLYCTPVVNLFEADADPIRIDHREAEYLVIPDVHRRRDVGVYDIQRAVGTEDATGRRHSYEPFFAFRHRAGQDRFFVETARAGLSNARETYLTLGGFGEDVGRMPVETLSLELRCTNGNLPREALQEGSINQLAPGVANVASFTNLTQPSRELNPPFDDHKQFFWKLLAHLSVNHMTVADRDALVGLLSLYDWSGSEANRRRLAGIRSVAWAAKEHIHRHSVMRGAEVTVEVQEGFFPDEGDLNLFGGVLSTFLSLYATLNSFVHLTIVIMPSGKRFQWQPMQGTRPPL